MSDLHGGHGGGGSHGGGSGHGGGGGGWKTLHSSGGGHDDHGAGHKEDHGEKHEKSEGGRKKPKDGKYQFMYHRDWIPEIWGDLKRAGKRIWKWLWPLILATFTLTITFAPGGIIAAFGVFAYVFVWTPIRSLVTTPIEFWWHNFPGYRFWVKREIKKRQRVYEDELAAGHPDNDKIQPKPIYVIPENRRDWRWVPYVYAPLLALFLGNILSFGSYVMDGVRSFSTPTERHESAAEMARKIGEALGHTTTPKPNLSRPATPAPDPAVIELTDREFKSVAIAREYRANVVRLGTAVVVRYPDGRTFNLYAYGTHPLCVNGDPDAVCSFELRGGKEVPIGGLPDIPNGARRAIEIKTMGGPGKVRIEYLK